jgi:hypothetical protein
VLNPKSSGSETKDELVPDILSLELKDKTTGVDSD